MLYRPNRVRAKTLALAATLTLVFSLLSFLTAPTISRAASPYNFGNVVIGQSVTHTFTLTATYAGNGHVINLYGSSAFTIVANTCPSYMAVGDTCDVTLKFSPITVGFHPGVIALDSLGTDSFVDSYGYGVQVTKVPANLPPAHLTCALSVSPDRSLAIDPETVVGVSFKVSNTGAGTSFAQHLEMPFSPALVAGYTSFNNSGLWVSRVDADSLTVEMPDLAPGKSYEGTIFFRPNPKSMPQNGQKVTFGYEVPFYDSEGKKVCQSNEGTVMFEGQNLDQTNGAVMEMTPAALVATPGDKVEATAKSFAPGEKVSSWLTNPDGSSKTLGDDRADYTTGDYIIKVDTTGLGVGTYVIAVYGHESKITFRAVLTIK